MKQPTTRIRATVGERQFTGDVVTVRTETQGALATIAFSNEFPALLIGESIDFEVLGSSGAAFQGKVVFQGSVDGGQYCQLLVGPSAVAHLNPQQNARELVRVRPAATAPITATLADKCLGVHDISTGGIAILVPAEEQGGVPAGSELHFSLALPGGGQPLAMVGRLVHRRLLGSAVVYGVQFDQRATESFGDKEERIQEYVMQRQQELLRSKR